MLQGSDGTKLRNTTQRLEDAWFTWQAATLSAEMETNIAWKFDATGFDQSLQMHAPFLKQVNLAEVAADIHNCPRCRAQLTINLDGTAGVYFGNREFKQGRISILIDLCLDLALPF